MPQCIVTEGLIVLISIDSEWSLLETEGWDGQDMLAMKSERAKHKNNQADQATGSQNTHDCLRPSISSSRIHIESGSGGASGSD